MFKACFFFTFCFLLHNIREIKSQQPEEICFRPPTNPNPGRPGKRGPPGGKGDKGDVGPTGQCVCDGMSQLRQEIQQLNRSRHSSSSSILILISVSCEIILVKPHSHKRSLVIHSPVTHCSVGMKDRRVRDEDITASATYGGQFSTCCKPYINEISPGNWIQVDLKSPTLLTGVVTQGRPGGHYLQWVTNYKIAYGINQTNFQTIQNSDGNDVVSFGKIRKRIGNKMFFLCNDKNEFFGLFTSYCLSIDDKN
ncbi:uncharacterized protein LOC113474033 [Ciona intestinalis]